MSNVNNIFVGNGSALEADVNTLTAGKLGVFKKDETALGAAQPYIASTATESIRLSETFSDGSMKKSMVIDGRNVTSARFEKYAPAAREVWSIGHSRKTATGTIQVNNSTEYGFAINFNNDKAFYSERQEVLRGNFTSASTATQLSIATQIAAIINNGAFKSQIVAIVVGDGTGVYGVTGATDFGVEITALTINQFSSTTYKENRVSFTVSVDDSTGFEDTTTCTQIQANSYGMGTYNSIYNKENFDYQFEGLMNRIKFPIPSVKINAVSTGYLSGSVVAAATTPTGALAAASGTTSNAVGADLVVVATATGGLRAGEIVSLNSVIYEIKYIIDGTSFVLTSPLTAVVAGTAFLVKYFYDVIVITFEDSSFIAGPGLATRASKSVMIATASINAGSADPFDKANLDTGGFSTEGVALLTNIGAWLASTPVAITTASLIA